MRKPYLVSAFLFLVSFMTCSWRLLLVTLPAVAVNLVVLVVPELAENRCLEG